jgi:hypothetical protein
VKIVSTIDRPLADEHVIAVDPPLMPQLDAVWRRRINPFTGRALSDRALAAEQACSAGIQRLRGQNVTPGIISGLDLLLEPGALGALPDDALIQILPGYGLAASGEDINVSTPRRIALGKLPVHARVDTLDAIAADKSAPKSAEPKGTGTLPPLLPRRIGPALGTLIGAKAAGALPRVMVLVAEPITATIEARPRDTCPPDPRDDPYDDLRLIDGVRLILVAWPSELTAKGIPDYALPAPATDRRNRVAYRVFDAECARAPGALHPWEAIGVPIALVGFTTDWKLDFVDRAAVVRLGGQPNPRTPLTIGSGSPLLWQARVSQFVEQIADLDSLTAASLTAAFRELPPVGFLPASVIDLTARRQDFFPPGFSLSASPIPLEHLDFAVGQSAGLAPINLAYPDILELLVPVPERVYEPGLLETAVVDPAFAQAMAHYIDDRSDWLIRRELLMRRRDLLMDSVTGSRPSHAMLAVTEALPYPSERAPVTATRFRRVESGGTVKAHQLSNAGSSLVFAKGDRVFAWVRVVPQTSPTGLAIRFSIAGGFGPAVFWGSSSGMPVGANADLGPRDMGDLPEAGVWTRLEASVDTAWLASGAPLAGSVAKGVELTQNGGIVEWGPVGKADADGNETIWIADDAPPASVLTTGGNPGWTQTSSTLGDSPVEGDFGTTEASGIRTANALERFRARWGQGFLDRDFADLSEGGIEGFTAAIETRLRITNDAIDLGFVRARADIYRVRQYLLGGDAASRLVTSPALADLAHRDESARATSEGLAAFLKTAYKTDFTRDENFPLETKPATGRTAPVSDPEPRKKKEEKSAASTLFLNGLAISQYSLTNNVMSYQVASHAVNGAKAAKTQASYSAISWAQVSKDLPQYSIAASAVQMLAYRPTDVQAQHPVPGMVERSLSIAERLRPAPAVEAHAYAIAGKYAVVNAIAGLIGDPLTGDGRTGIALGDLPAPGFTFTPGTAPPPPRKKGSVGDVILDRAKTGDNNEYRDDDERTAQDSRHEADYFTSAVRAIDNTVALMRLVEGRIDLYNQLLADARSVREEMLDQVAGIDTRLRVIAVELEEARHDVSVATALLAEERDRVQALNARRKAILDANVKAIVFRRPRLADRSNAIPVAPAVAALMESPVTACLREHENVPEELREFTALFREAAVAWFPGVKAQLALIDRLDAARRALVAVRVRAANPFLLQYAPPSNPPVMLAAIHTAIAAQRTLFDARRAMALDIDVAGAASSQLSSALVALAQHASLADMIAGDHQRAVLSRMAASEVEGLAQVAGCLHASFGETPPIMRLEWAELLSEFDRPAPLSNLAGLPGWHDLPIALRRTQQGFVDWLFSRIDRSIAPAEAAINELVRICILLAAHAPVERIIPARLIAPVPARIGIRLDLAIDISIARVGMAVLVRGADQQSVAHAIIDDIGDGLARARIVKLYDQTTTIAQTMSFHVSDAGAH